MLDLNTVYQNYASVQTVLSIKLKFDMYIVDPRSSCYINFGVSRKCNFLQDAKNVTHYGLQAQNIKRRFSIFKLFESVQN